jgi:hypothetical protein
VACSLLTVEHFSRGASVNLDHCNLQIDEQIPVVAAQNQNLVYSGPRIERCESEKLVERTMEILSARARVPALPTPEPADRKGRERRAKFVPLAIPVFIPCIIPRVISR